MPHNSMLFQQNNVYITQQQPQPHFTPARTRL